MAALIPTLEEIREAVRQVVREELGRAGPEVLSTEQAAELAGRSVKTILVWINEKGLPAGRRGRTRTIKRDDLLAFLAGENEPDRSSPAARISAAIRKAS